MSEKTEQMTPELKAFIEEWKGKPGNLIMVLHKVQQTYGYIPREIAIEISSLLDVPLAKIYGVVTFYNFFKLQKAGKYIIQVCLGTACYVKGSEGVLRELERVLGVIKISLPCGKSFGNLDELDVINEISKRRLFGKYRKRGKGKKRAGAKRDGYYPFE